MGRVCAPECAPTVTASKAIVPTYPLPVSLMAAWQLDFQKLGSTLYAVTLAASPIPQASSSRIKSCLSLPLCHRQRRVWCPSARRQAPAAAGSSHQRSIGLNTVANSARPSLSPATAVSPGRWALECDGSCESPSGSARKVWRCNSGRE